MRDFERAVGETTLLVRSDPRLETQAEWLLRTLGKVLEATQFREGMTVQVGWTRFSLRSQAGRIVVCEPAFHGNPFTQSNQDVTLSLAVLAAHDDIIQALGIDPESVSFHHSVLIRRDCLSEARVSMKRRAVAQGDDSGWVVGLDEVPDDEDAAERIEWIRTTELLRVRRPLILPLVAPTGWAVAWDGQTIESMTDDAQAERWTPKAAEALRENVERLEWAWRHPTGRSTPPS
jgi:hypothetical protein